MQSSLDAWVEPSPQNPTPSFEEHGFVRHGVLETMAPLGVPPTTRVKQKARSLGETLAKGPMSRKRGAPVDEEGTTPELTPAPEVGQDESEPLEEDEDIQAPFPEQDEEDDDDYKPKTHPKKKQKISHTPVRGKGTPHHKTASAAKSPAAKSPAKNGLKTAPPSAPALPAPPASQANMPPSQLDAAAMQTLEIAVNDAHARSLKDNRPSIGIALRRMFDEGKRDTTLSHALNGIIHQKESAEDYSNFRSYIKEAKKKIKRDWKIQKAEDAAKAAKTLQQDEGTVSSPATGGEDAAYPTNLEVQPIIAAPMESPSSDNALSPAGSSESIEASEPTPHPLSTAPAFPAGKASTPPAPRMASKSPRKRAANGTLALGNGVDAGVATPVAGPTPVPKSPAGSDSGLSEVDEEILHTGPPQPTPQVNGNSMVAPNKKTKNLGGRPKKQQGSRANSEKPLGSTKPYGKRSKQNVPRTAEQLAEEAETERKRQELGRKQQERFGDQLSGYLPLSDMRFDDDETASMTESIAAMGPPGDINRPRRAGRHGARNGLAVQTSGMKRGRENSFFSSPHPDSAANSRPSTPAGVGHIATKRLKLNNGHAGQAHQAARTKKS